MLLDMSRLPVRRSIIRWTDEEWDRITEIVYRTRLAEPEEGLVPLVNRAMEQMPAERRRNIISSAELRPLIGRLRTRYSQMLADAAEAERLQNRPSREEMLEGLTDTEVIHRFRDRVLRLCGLADPAGQLAAMPTRDLLRAAADRMAIWIESSTGRPTTAEDLLPVIPPTPTPKPPSIALIGLKPDQFGQVAQRVNGRARLRYVPKDREAALPESADLFILWGKFIGHETQNRAIRLVGRERVKIVFGGLDTLARAVVDCVGGGAL